MRDLLAVVSLRRLRLLWGFEMSKTVRIEGFIQAKRFDRSNEIGYYFVQSKNMTEYGYMLVCPHVIEFELPPDFNPVAKELEALNAQKEKLRQEFAASVRRIDEQISKLQAIEFTPSDESAVGVE